MDCQVVVPWSDDGCPDRRRALLWCVAQWQAAGYPVEVSVGTGLPWCKALALAGAVDATDATVLVVADADVWCEPRVVHEAVAACHQGAPWAVPHLRVHRLTRGATRAVLDGPVPPDPACPLDEVPYVGVAGGGLVVVRTAVARDVPMDVRYKGWGREDLSWGQALATLAADPWRPAVGQPLYHLWHRAPVRVDRYRGTYATEPLYQQYFTAWAARDTAAMRRLVEDGRGWLGD